MSLETRILVYVIVIINKYVLSYYYVSDMSCVSSVSYMHYLLLTKTL